MLKLMRKKIISFLSEAEKNFEYSVQISRREKRDIERLFGRLFSTEDGKKVLAYLHYTTFQRAMGVNVSDEQLRYAEGQRSLVSTILRLVDRGRHG